jgi:hypothetical protein
MGFVVAQPLLPTDAARLAVSSIPFTGRFFIQLNAGARAGYGAGLSRCYENRW